MAVQPPCSLSTWSSSAGELITVDVGAKDFSIGTAKVMARPIPHAGVTLGFRIEAEGRSVAYMSDHQAPLDRRAVPDAVLELCQDVDLLIHDGQYTEDEFSAKADWVTRPRPTRSTWRPSPAQSVCCSRTTIRRTRTANWTGS